MEKNEFWGLICTCEEAKDRGTEGSPIYTADEFGMPESISIYPSKELAQLASSKMLDCNGRQPLVIRFKTTVVERLDA